ncbi:hypothetical protein BX600DRAFT_245742 [Xylariales sp. PMI_506]|nr:hypothetical protein BX600DRAFT_245742 [Xylariales sp. PMI_506]
MIETVLTGRIFPALIGSDIHERAVGVPDHFHGDHIRAQKVRPAVGMYSEPEDHKGHTGKSKVHTAKILLEQDSGRDFFKPHHEGHSSTSKVYPVSESCSGEFDHLGHMEGISKVRMMYTGVNDPNRTISPSGHSTESKIQSPMQQAQDSQGAINYSDFPPGSISEYQPRQGESSNELLDNNDTTVSDDCNDNATILTFRSVPQSQNSGGRTVSSVPSRNESPDLPNYETFNEKFWPLTYTKGKATQEQTQKEILGRSSSNRTTQWLRDILRYREPHPPQFTQHHKAQRTGYEKRDNEQGTVNTASFKKVAIFSNENIADAKAINTAVDNLENLLSEALDIANGVVERDEEHFRGCQPCKHEDEDTLDTYSPSSSHSVAPVRLDLEEDCLQVSNIAAQTDSPPPVFVGAVGGLGHGCESLPLRSMKQRKLRDRSMYSNIIRDPKYPDRTSSLRTFGKGKRVTPPPTASRRDVVFNKGCTHGFPPREQGEIKIVGNIRVNTIPYTDQFISGLQEHSAVSPPSSMKSKGEHDRFQLSPRERDACSLDGGTFDDIIDFSTQSQSRQVIREFGIVENAGDQLNAHRLTDVTGKTSFKKSASKTTHNRRMFGLRDRSHLSIKGSKFSLTKSRRRQPIARDWSPTRKRFVATVVCIGTALIGILIGIYAGIVPAVQYYIADTHHYAVLGNVCLYIGLALPSFFCWPLPLLHGRRPYILSGLTVALPLLFPQAITVSANRSPDKTIWQWALLLSRSLMGASLGFASMNFHATLTDLFGVSLMSSKPHGEIVDCYDVRRHGGGLGVWLGIWTWCLIGSLGVGFLIGATLIDSLSPVWGFYISIVLLAVVIVLNVLTPEVRRSAWRRSVTEVRKGDQISRRVARGEIMMHRVKDGPTWWGQEVYHGVALSMEMLRQPGFAVMAIYSS